MNTYISFLNQFIQQQKICAIYFKSPNGLSNLEFYFCEYQKNKIILTKKFNDIPFFNFLYQKHKIGKNTLLEIIHQEYQKEKYLHLPYSVDIIITKPLN